MRGFCAKPTSFRCLKREIFDFSKNTSMEPVLFLGKKLKVSTRFRGGDCPESPHWGIRIGTGEKNRPRESPTQSIDCLRTAAAHRPARRLTARVPFLRSFPSLDQALPGCHWHHAPTAPRTPIPSERASGFDNWQLEIKPTRACEIYHLWSLRQKAKCNKQGSATWMDVQGGWFAGCATWLLQQAK